MADSTMITRADVVFAVLIERAGQRILARELAEHQRDQQHQTDDHRDRPDVAGSTAAQAQRIERVNAHHRAQIAERNGKVVEQRKNARELLAVAERAEAGVRWCFAHACAYFV
jgi:hypothetical protein